MLMLTKNQIRLTSIASCLGILQGLAWFLMSLLCIIYYLKSNNNDMPSVSDNPNYIEIFEYNLFTLFLNANYNAFPDSVLIPETFTIFMWIYLFIDLIWILLSIYQLVFINKAGANPINSMKCWGVMTILISLIDFLLVILLGVDFDSNCPKESMDGYCTNAYIPVLVIAAKGFVLWIINVVFAYVIYRIIKTVQSGKNLNTKLWSTTAQIPRATLQRPSRNDQNQAGPNNNYPNNFNRNNNSYWPANNSGNNSGGNLYNQRPAPVNPSNFPRQQLHQQQSYTGY